MIIAVTTPKGGAGKTTITINLAVGFAHMGKRVCIVDADEGQFSATQWAEFREDDRVHIPVFKVPKEKLNREVKGLEKDFDLVFIDGRPTLSSTADRIVLASDVLIIPVMPSLFDLSAFEEYLPRYKEVKGIKEEYGGSVTAYVLLNGLIVNTNISEEIEDAVKDVVEKSGLAECLESKIMRRVAYGNSPTNGLGVIEENDKKAKDEMTSLVNEISVKIQNNV